MRSFCLGLALSSFACGGDASPDAAVPDAAPVDADDRPGSGTLLIEGECIAENPGNITDGMNFMVRCSVIVSQGGEPVTDAIIQISPPGGFVTTLVADDLTPNVYVGTYFSYSDTMRFEVYQASAPRDHFLRELTLEGPDPFEIEMPARGSLHPVTEDLHVTWGLPGGATSFTDVELVASGYANLGMTDSGSLDIPAAELVASEDEVVIVRRWRHNLIPAGAAAGSYVDISVESHQPVILQ